MNEFPGTKAMNRVCWHVERMVRSWCGMWDPPGSPAGP